MLKSKTQEPGAASMGVSAIGGVSGHILTLALGFLGSQFFGTGSSLQDTIQEATRLASERCIEGCRIDCNVVTEQHSHFEWHSAFNIGLSLVSISGWLSFACWWLRRRKQTVTVSRIPESVDSSPSGVDDRRQLALLQLAEVRARGRRNGSAQ